MAKKKMAPKKSRPAKKTAKKPARKSTRKTKKSKAKKPAKKKAKPSMAMAALPSPAAAITPFVRITFPPGPGAFSRANFISSGSYGSVTSVSGVLNPVAGGGSIFGNTIQFGAGAWRISFGTPPATTYNLVVTGSTGCFDSVNGVTLN